ncbi:alpha-amylase [Leptolyngbya sp. BC1307]|uniref:alpha-amylase n=1 Tax=Leptolyngbya sp. BC1307 TaxID=2029589 RepID=UPI000EFD7646|nr:alpha-amylase [Leptolyngbya sp. BC1307]
MINGTILQCFHWYTPADGYLWKQVAATAADLAQAGFSALWLPPMTKASGGADDVGYSAYDLYDLGEFDQCGSVATKYGSYQALLTAIAAAHTAGLQVYGDVVLHRKHGGDEVEHLSGTPVAWRNLDRAIGPTQTIAARSRFTFSGRGQRYSAMTWQGKHFQLVNHNCLAKPSDLAGQRVLYRLKSKPFSAEADVRLGRQERCCELDLDMPVVAQALDDWGHWFVTTTGIDGLRLDGAKHLSALFVQKWLWRLHERLAAERPEESDRPASALFAMGDCWSDQVNDLHWYIAKSGGQLSLFDVPLHYNFHRASRQGCYYDLRHVLTGTLMDEQPALAVTFVDNHNSQPLQILESPVEDWFKPLAYALILLRQEGYPCVFAADYYGAHAEIINRLLWVRSHCAYGEQYDYFVRPDLIGWTRLGNAENLGAIAVVLSNHQGGSLWMELGKPDTQFVDITQSLSEPVWTNANGWGNFDCLGRSVSVWVEAIYGDLAFDKLDRATP